MLCCTISVVISILISMVICRVMGIDEEITRSIATRSITTPLAMSVSESLGGIPSIAAAVVIMVGISGAVIGFPLLKLFRRYMINPPSHHYNTLHNDTQHKFAKILT